MYEFVTPAGAGVQPAVAFAGLTATFYFTGPEQ